MARALDTIIELQDALGRLRAAERQLEGIPDWMRELHAEYRTHMEEIEVLERQVEEAAAERRAAEAEISDTEEKLKRYQRQINEVSNQREYGALLQEIDTAKGTISELEDRAFSAMEQVDEATAALDEQREASQGLEQRYQAELAKWEEEKPAITEEAEKLRGRVEVLRERVPRPHLAHFERIFERTGGKALSPIRKVERPKGPAMWHCGTCHYNVRPQVLVEIQDRGSLIQCDSCKRILYLGSAGESSGHDEQGETTATAEG